MFQLLMNEPRLLDCQQKVPAPSKVNGAAMVAVTGLHAPPVTAVGVRVGVALGPIGVFVRVAVRVGVRVGPMGVFVRVGVRVGVKVGPVGVLVRVAVRVGVNVGPIGVLVRVAVRVGVKVGPPPGKTRLV